MTVPNDLTALAEACERAASTCQMELHVGDSEMCRCRDCGTLAARIDLLRTHAAAIRAGRVTVNEETTDGTV